MKTVILDAPDDFEGWRDGAREAFAEGMRPGEVSFRLRDEAADLFGGLAEPTQGRLVSQTALFVPKSFPEFARQVVCHSDPERFALLYRILIRLQREKGLMANPADADMARAHALAKEVRRDRHKMKAFVRFRKTGETEDGTEQFVAWFEPTHHIVRLTAGFFERRFSNMHWSILTPRGCAHYDGRTTRFTAGVDKSKAPPADALEDYWRSYYASIFNPARLKIDAMTSEMPKKYWKNLPEAQLIPELIRSAREREGEMVKAAPTLPIPSRMAHREIARKPHLPDRDDIVTLDDLNALIRADRLYPPALMATQAVCGSGPVGAPLMLVGEQPGDQEDLAGEPFVGPAGRLLRDIMAQTGVDDPYLTNAVKHFKYEPRGKRRLHKTPSAPEIEHCRWWLMKEIKLVSPKVVVALGATAIRGITGQSGKVGDMRGREFALPEGPRLVVTRHPSSILRAGDDHAARVARQELHDDLAFAKRLAMAGVVA